MRTEQSAARGSDVHIMEPLLGQASFSEVVNSRTNCDHSASQNQAATLRRPSPEIIDSANEFLQNGFAEYALQGSEPLSKSYSSSSSSSDISRLTAVNTASLTSLDIATLRKCLSRKPKLRRVCHICGRECPSRHKLQRHLSTHSEKRPYNCEICGKAFKWTEYLSKHMRTQHGPGSSNVTKTYIRRNTESTSSSTDGGTPLYSPSAEIQTPPGNSTSSTSSNDAQESRQQSKESSLNTTTGFNGNQSQTPPDVFSPLEGNLMTNQSVTSSTLLQDQLQPYPGGPHGGYFPNSYPSMPYPPFPCYGYPGQMMPPMMGSMCHPFNNSMFPFDSTYQNFMPPHQQSLNPSHDASHALLSDIFSPVTTTPLTNNNYSTPNTTSCSTSNSISCQTQEQPQVVIDRLPRRQPVEIINLTTKKDVGIQCEVGDETLQALFEEERRAISSVEPVGTTAEYTEASETGFDEGSSCICKYPCEHEGCQRAYVHRKDLVRHMKVAHGVLPKLLQPRIIEAPAKPYVCQVAECGKSYYHLKDLRRHQRQCHLIGGLPPSSSSLEPLITHQVESEDTSTSSLRYPCDFKGCAKSYIHKKDLIRHKRMFHHDSSSHPSIPEPVIVIHVKKGLNSSISDEEVTKGTTSPSKEIQSLAEPLNNAHLPISNQPQSIDPAEEANLDCLNVSSIIDNFSAAVATIFDMDDTAASMFPMNFNSQVTDSSLSSFMNPPPLIPSNQDDVLGNISSPSTLTMTLLSQSI